MAENQKRGAECGHRSFSLVHCYLLECTQTMLTEKMRHSRRLDIGAADVGISDMSMFVAKGEAL